MLLWILIISLILLATAVVIMSKASSYSNNKVMKWIYHYCYEEWSYFLTIILLVIMIIANLIAIPVTIDSRLSNEIYYQKYIQQYEVLTYELENVKYDNDNELGKKELYTQIREYNIEVAGYKAQLENPWIGVFVAPCLADVPLIELS